MKSHTNVIRNSGMGIMDELVPIAIGVLLVALCIFHTGCGCILPHPTNGPGGIGTITSVRGRAIVTRGGDHLNAYSGMPLHLNDIVSTNSSSVVEISFPGIGQLLLNDERDTVTEIRIQNPSIFVSLGKLLFRLKRNLPWETKYVRGDVVRTVFSVRVYGDTVEVEIEEGEVVLRSKERSRWNPVVVVRGKKAVIRNVENPQVSDIREPIKPDTGDTEPGAGDTRPDIRDTMPDIRDTRSGIRDTRPDARAETIAEIGWLKGKASVLRNRKRIEAREGVSLQSGDLVRTSGSEALVAFPRAGQVQMVPASDNERDTEVEIHQSLVFVRLGKIQVESVANLSWETKYAHGDARRARYSVQVFKDTVTIAVDEGTVVLSPKGGASWRAVKVPAGKAANVYGRRAPVIYDIPR